MGKLFDAQMTALYERDVATVLDAYDFSGAGREIDIGGGRGTLTRALLAHLPKLQCGLFDLPAVAERARDSFLADGLSDRCQIEGGSFFDTIPSGYDTYLLKQVLHDWDDSKCLTILTNVRRAIGEGRLLILEQVVPPGNGPSVTKEYDLLMLALFKGKERTEAEFRELLTKTGFKLERTMPTDSLLNIFEARPV